MNYCFCVLLILVIMLQNMPSFAQPPRADDFLAPVAASSTEAKQEMQSISNPGEVKETTGFGNEPAISAANAQDAINAAVEHIEAGGGCEQIKFPSGFGWVSTGVGIYSPMPNPTATLIAQRNAYQVAYLNAKKNLAEALYGLSTEGKEQLQQAFDSVITENDTLTNMSDALKENINEQVKGILRGYVIYSVEDNQQDDKAGTVSVTIVATPKTMGKNQRVDTSSLTADSIKDGLDGVLAELGNGLIPPVGGKMISVPQTGEFAFVGFGTAVVVENPNPAIQAKMRIQAQSLAKMRARSALCGIILNTEVEAKSSLDSATQQLSQQFDKVQKDDPLNSNQDQAEIAKLAEQKNTFLTNQLTQEQISSVSKGVLPPGVSVKTFFNPEKTIAEAVAVYIPSVTANATKAGQDMKNSQIVAPQSGTGSTGAGTSYKSRTPEMPKQGPSGQISNASDL